MKSACIYNFHVVWMKSFTRKKTPTFQWEDKALSLVNVTLKPVFWVHRSHGCTWHVSHLISASFILCLSLKSFLSHHSSGMTSLLSTVVNVSYIHWTKVLFILIILPAFFSVRFMTFLVLTFFLFVLLDQQFVFVVSCRSSTLLAETLHTGLIFVTSNCAQMVHPVNDKFERLCLFSNCKLTGHGSEGLSG